MLCQHTANVSPAELYSDFSTTFVRDWVIYSAIFQALHMENEFVCISSLGLPSPCYENARFLMGDGVFWVFFFIFCKGTRCYSIIKMV